MNTLKTLMNTLKTLTPRLLAGFGTLALLGGMGLAASRPARTAGGPVSVSVANMPLATTAADGQTKQPFQGRTKYLISQGSHYGTLDTLENYSEITVPAGKRLVVQTVTVQESTDGGAVNAGISTHAGGGYADPYLLPPIVNTHLQYPMATEALTVTADPGTTLPLVLERTGTDSTAGPTVGYFCTVYGYLVNL